MTMPDLNNKAVLRMADIPADELRAILDVYGMRLVLQAPDDAIIGSFWGDEEAGLVGNTLYVRPDTPIHSALHEACHYICMDEQRRADLHTDAGGDYDEENAVCYLQILLAGAVRSMGMQRMFSDMDSWGYTFRLSSAERWFWHDADDAARWLEQRRLLVRVSSRHWLVLPDIGLLTYP